jgi:hypothetical protein
LSISPGAHHRGRDVPRARPHGDADDLLLRHMQDEIKRPTPNAQLFDRALDAARDLSELNAQRPALKTLMRPSTVAKVDRLAAARRCGPPKAQSQPSSLRKRPAAGDVTASLSENR